jgi:hypothetical protein
MAELRAGTNDDGSKSGQGEWAPGAHASSMRPTAPRHCLQMESVTATA